MRYSMDNIDSLKTKIEHLENVISSYKQEVKNLRAEYAQMKKERDIALEMQIKDSDSTITE